MLVGAIEGGGTKFVCAVADESGTILARERIATTAPAPTLAEVVRTLKTFEAQLGQPLTAVGIACFGPLDLHTDSPTYGHVTATPKPGWSGADIVGPVRAAFPGIPVAFAIDVYGAAVGEQRWGAGQAWQTFVYITVGTGIGGGVMVNGGPIHGLLHSEIGHLPLTLHPDDPLQRGVCPFHPQCLEGLACGPSLQARWGVPGEHLPVDHPAWTIEAYYLAQACVALIYTLSPEGIILGGSVMHQQQLFPLIRRNVQQMMGGYMQHPRLEGDGFIVPPGLGDDAGVLGAVALGLDALERA